MTRTSFFAKTPLDDTAGGTNAEVTKAPTSNAFYDFVIQKAAASGLASLDASSVVVQAAVKSYVILVEREMTTASGDVAYTSVGFKPRALIAFSVYEDDTAYCWGMCDSALNQGVAIRGDAGTLSHSFSGMIYLSHTEWSVYQKALVKSLDADGFTLTWTKAGSPTAAFACTFVLCLK